MNFRLTILLLGLFIISGVNAGTGHSHGVAAKPVNMETAKTRAAAIVTSLVNRKKLDKSWEKVKVSTIEKKNYNGNDEWVVTFNNQSVKDKSKSTLFVFLTIGGEYIAANFTGQ